ncbi:MAG: glycerophosphodiester phosphodiesterase [Bryobacterales bacterium]|nr:glycerophosphodiester phosphodiesterase [Bryobacterales bacterium]
MRWIPFLLLIAISLGAQTARAPKRILVEGHRGARWAMPENTIPAFRHAIKVGADVLELDVGVTKDNVLVVSHDLEIKPAICKGPEGLPRAIRQLTLSEIKQFDCGWMKNPDFPEQQAIPGTRMPTLEEVFRELAPLGGFRFNVEMKSNPAKPDLTPPADEFARLVLAEIRKFKLEKRVVVQSFDFGMLRALGRIAPQLSRAALFSAKGDGFLAIAKEAGGVDVLSPQLRLVTPENVREAHAAGLTVVPWTANQPEEWQTLIDAGVDAIITDHPEGLLKYLKERNLH